MVGGALACIEKDPGFFAALRMTKKNNQASVLEEWPPNP
jgi:hypothetical protein